jgi:hypothetical protein
MKKGTYVKIIKDVTGKNKDTIGIITKVIKINKNDDYPIELEGFMCAKIRELKISTKAEYIAYNL